MNYTADEKKYERLTDKYYFDCNKCVDGECSTPDIFCQYRYRCEIYNRLHSLEDKIESGELVFRDVEE